MTRLPQTSDKRPTPWTGCGVALATGLALGLGVMLVWFAALRENHGFWTNAGGYPVWLRHLVLWTYLPLFAATVFLLGSLSLVWLVRLGRRLRVVVAEIVLLALGWALLAASGVIAFRNNIGNFLEGRDLHGHHDGTRN